MSNPSINGPSKGEKIRTSILLGLITLSISIVPFLELVCVNFGDAYWVNAPICGYILLFPLVLLGCDFKSTRYWDIFSFLVFELLLLGFRYIRHATLGRAIDICMTTIIAFYCAILFHRLLSLLINKTKSKLINKLIILEYIPFLVIILVPIIGVRNDYLTYLPIMIVTLLSLYSAPFCNLKYEKVVISIVNGIIISFFLIQGLALVFRPYDIVRYSGIFSGSASNSMFYCLVEVAFLAKAGEFSERKLLRRLFYVLGVLSSALCILTMSRTSIIICFICLFIFLVYITRLEQKKILTFIMRSFGTVILVCFSVVIVFLVVRYVPPIFHHPVWFGAEYSESRVHSFDGVNSEKYVSLDEVVGALFGRFSVKKVADTDLQYEDIERDDSNIVENIEEQDSKGQILSYKDGVEPGSDSLHPVFLVLNYDSVIKKIARERYYIFRYTIPKLSVVGESKPEYPFMWITSTFCAQHTHNDFLQMAYNYGLLSAILLYGIYLFALAYSCRYVIKKGSYSWVYLFIILLIVNNVLTGLTEVLNISIRMMPYILYAALTPIVNTGIRGRLNYSDSKSKISSQENA